MSDIPFTADELRRMLNEQDAEIERLRAALQHISNLSPTEPPAMQITARRALAQEKTND